MIACVRIAGVEMCIRDSLLRDWIERPLCDAEQIGRRLDAVECFTQRPFEANALRESLSGVYDVERLLSRIAYDALNARDCIALRTTLQVVPLIRKDAAACDAALIQRCAQTLDPMDDVCTLLSRAIDDNAPLTVREGGMIRDGYNAELDELRDISHNGKTYLAELEQVAATVKTANHIFIRYTPRVVKEFMIRRVYRVIAGTGMTTCLLYTSRCV